MKYDAERPPRRRAPAERRERVKKERPPIESADSDWRLFLAVPLPQEVKQRLAAITDQLASTDLPARWVDADSAHLTLHFLGDTPPETAELLRMALPAVVSAHPPFELRTADPGAFPSLRRPRVLWLGLWGPTHRLESLFNDIGDFLDDFGIEIEESDLHPHITFGRIRDTEGVRVGSLPEQTREAFESLRQSMLVGSENAVKFPVSSVQLIRSHLGKNGARYEVLREYSLSGKEDA